MDSVWQKAIEVVKELQNETPQIYFMDGNSLTGKEAWAKCLKVVLQRLQQRSQVDEVNDE